MEFLFSGPSYCDGIAVLQDVSGDPLAYLMCNSVNAATSLRPNEVPVRRMPDGSLSGREKVVEKNGPFSLTFSQIVALMFAHRGVFAGWAAAGFKDTALGV